MIAFGALVAAGIPLLLALTAIFATFGLIAMPSHILPVAQQAPALVLLIGLAVGVDYSMFYLRREREERAAGRSERAAIEAAAATSGRSVLISGLTVMTAMAGMFLTGDQIFASFGVATILVVAIAMLGSLTVLPALLSRLGDGVDRGRVPLVSRLRRDDGDGRIWGAVSTASCAGRCSRPSSRAGSCSCSRFRPSSSRSRTRARTRSRSRSRSCRRYDRMQGAFPGTAMAASVVVQAPNVKSPQMQRRDRRLEQRALASGRMYRPFTVDVEPGRNGREHHGADRGQGDRRGVERVAGPAAQRDRCRDRRRAPGNRSRRHGLHGPVEGLERQVKASCRPSSRSSSCSRSCSCSSRSARS